MVQSGFINSCVKEKKAAEDFLSEILEKYPKNIAGQNRVSKPTISFNISEDFNAKEARAALNALSLLEWAKIMAQANKELMGKEGEKDDNKAERQKTEQSNTNMRPDIQNNCKFLFKRLESM